MSPQEKWQRLTNPQCAADYGIAMTESELATIPQGQAILRALSQIDAGLNDPHWRELMRQAGCNAAATLDGIMASIILGINGKQPEPTP